MKSVLEGLRSRFLRQAKTIEQREDDEHLAALAEATLAQAVGIEGRPFTLGSKLSSAEAENMATEAAELMAALGETKDGAVIGRSGDAHNTLLALWKAMAFGWRMALSKEKKTELAKLLVGDNYGTLSDSEAQKVYQALTDPFKQAGLEFLVELLSLGTPGTVETVVRRGAHMLADKGSTEQLVFAAACLGAVKAPVSWDSGNKHPYWFIKDACVAAVRQVDEATRMVRSIPFNQIRGEPPHRRLSMISPTKFQFAWHTSSPAGEVFDKNVQYYDEWLRKAIELTISSLSPQVTERFAVRLEIRFVEHEPLWGVGAQEDVFPPIVHTLMRATSTRV